MFARRAVSASLVRFRALCVFLIGLLAFSAAAQAPQRQVLQHHVRPEVTNHTAPLVANVPDDQVLRATIVMPLRKPDELTALLGRLYDPASPDYRHFLSVDEFTERFGPTREDFATVVAYAKRNGFTVSELPANRMIVPISGTAAQINAAFQVQMRVYQHPTENRTFISADREPSLDLAVPVAHIAGLNGFSLPQATVVHRPAASAVQPSAVTGSGPGGSYLGSDMRAAYYGGTALTGLGQTVGLLEYGGYARSDVDLTFSNAGQSYSVPINDVLLDGATTGSGANDGEQVLDIVQAIGMAPGLSQVRVYIAPNQNGEDPAILNAMASENIAKVLSASWCWYPDDPAVDDPFFKEMAAQGQTFLTASADHGAFDAAIYPYFYPQEDAYVTAVGGTHLTTNGAGGGYVSESVWNSDGDGSGGGISPDAIPIPSWQNGVANSANGGSTTLRNVPDIAMEGDFDNYSCQDGSCDGGWAGTSFATPRWAGFMALVNQQAQEAGNAPSGGLGFINPALYSLAQASATSSDFHDVTAGNNDTNGQPLWYSAVPGYDLATGWGSAAGQPLIDSLAGPQVPGFWLISSQSSLGVAPGNIASATLTITPAGGFNGSVNLSVTGLPPDVTASFSPNPATGTTVVTFTASASAVQSTEEVTITGTSGTLSASTKISLAVHTPTFALTVTPSSLGISQGSTGTSTIAVTPQFGFSGTVNLSATGLPAGVTASFSPAATSGNSTMTLSVSNTATPGNSTFTVTGTSGSITVSTAVTLSIHGPSFTLLASASSITVGQGSTGSTSVYVEDVYGFTGAVNLAVSGLPAGVAATVTPNPTSSYATITFTASSTATVGSGTVTITGTSGSLSSSTTVALSIVQPTFLLSTASTVALGQGTTANSYVYIESEYGFNGSVNLSISGLPTGVTAVWSPNPTTSTSTLTFAATSAAATGQYPLTITGTWGGQTVTAKLTLGVYAPTFTLSGGGSVQIGQGSTTTSYIYVNPEYGFTGSVNLTATNLPAGVTASFSPNPTTGYASITLSASSTAKIGQYTITITGTSGSQTATMTLSLGVFAPSFTLGNFGGFSVGRGATAATGYVYVSPQYGFSGSVNLSASGLPAGVTASFSPNPTTGTSTMSVSASASAPLGQYNVTVTGTSGTLTASTTISITIYDPTFSLSASSSAVLGQGSSTTSYVYVTPQYGFAGSVNLGVTGLPAGVTASFSPNPSTGTAILTLNASSTAAAGQYPLTITGTSGTITRTASLALTVGAPAFTLSASGTTIGQGGTGSGYVYVTDQFGFSGAVNLSISGLPAGITASFNPASTTYYSTVTFNVASTAANGSTTLTITGTSGTKTVTTTMVLTVVAPTFSLYGGLSTVQVNQGASTTNYVYISGQYGFGGAVTLTATGVPTGASVVFSPNPTTAYSNQYTISAGTAAPGSYPITITGTSGTATASTSLTLTVEAATFTLSAAPSTIALPPGSSRSSTITLVPQYGFSGSASFTVSGLPAGVTATISPNPSSGQTVLTLTAASGAATGSATVTVTGTSGSTSAAVPIAVNVVAAAQATTTTLEATYNGQSVSSLSAGVPVTLTATVTAGNSPVTAGQVVFCDATAKFCDPVHQLGTAQLTSAGAATLKFIPSPGNNSYHAVFQPTVANGTSTSANVPLAVNAAFASQTAMSVSGSAGNYSVTATVTGNGPVAPSGSVSILDATEGNASIGSAPLIAGASKLSGKVVSSPATAFVQTAVASGDFNGDGITDLVIAANNSTLYLFLGNGDGTFKSPTVITVIYNPAGGIVVADFNGDGRLDIAATVTSDTVAICLGNGDGTFTMAPVNPQTGYGPHGLVGGDFNGDGLEDLAVANTSSSSLTILLGNGSGGFNTSTVNLASGFEASLLVAGDFNGDGVQDLAVASSSNGVSPIVLLGNGDGSFSAGVTLSTGSAAFGMAVGDLNGDGKLDIVTANPGGATYSVFLGNGDGTFSGTNSPTLSQAPYTVAISDVNRDGKPDLVFASNASAIVYVLLGAGDGTFSLPAASGVSTGNNPEALVVTDFNGDGIPDLATINSNSANISIVSFQLAQTATGTVTGISPHGAGQHTVEAKFPGDTVFAASTSATQNLTASVFAPTVTVKPASGTIGPAQSLSVGITVAGGSADPMPTGSVQLTSGGYTSSAMPLAGGSAILSVPAGALAAGSDTLTVTYRPDTASSGAYTSATGTATVTETQATPTVTLSASPSNPTANQAVTVTVTVSGGTGSPSPTGSVVFTSGSYTAPAASLSAGSVAIGVPAGALPDGADTLSAVYTPDTASAAIYTTATGNSTLTVGKVTPTITWTAPTAITYGAALSGVQQNATASVPGTFTYSPALGTVLPAGSQTLSVSFTPTDTANYSVSTGTVTLVVNKAPLTLTAASATRPFGAANPAFTGAITGEVNGDVLAETFTTTAAANSPAGTYPIVPAAAGVALGNYAVNATSGTLTVTTAGTATAFSLSNGNLTFTATVTSAAGGSPTGQVTFYAGTTALGSGILNAGTASYTASTFPAGDAVLSAVYAGDGSYAGSTSAAVPVLSVAASSTAVTVAPGSTAQDTMTFTVAPGYTGSLQVACAGLPQYASCSLAPSTVAFSGSATTATAVLTIHTGGSAGVSPAAVPLRSQASRIWLAALGLPGLLGVAFAARRRRFRGIAGTLATLAVFAFASLVLTGCGGGRGGGGSSGSGSGSGSSSSQTPAGSYTVQVTATGAASLTQTTNLTLTVQ